jgi:hypothetical protein
VVSDGEGEGIPMMLRVMAAASAPLLISVGGSRCVRLGGSSSASGTPVTLGARDGSTIIVPESEAGWLGRAILLENTWEDSVVGGGEEVGDAEELGRDEVAWVVGAGVAVTVDGSVARGGAPATIPCDVGTAKAVEEDDEVVLVKVWLDFFGLFGLLGLLGLFGLDGGLEL